jgi:magnesium transporter
MGGWRAGSDEGGATMPHAFEPAAIAHEAAALAATLAPRHVADIVDALNRLPAATVAAVLEHLPFDVAVDVLDQPNLAAAAEVMKRMPAEQALTLLPAMSADRAANLFRNLDEPIRSRLLARLDPGARTSLQQLLAYPPETAGSLMTTEFIGVPATWTVDRTLQHIRDVESTRETVYAVYVLDPATRRLLVAVSLRQLIVSRPDASLLAVASHRRPIVATPLMDREDLARLISKYDLLAVPIVDAAGQVLGIVTFDDIIDSMVEESTEDVQRLGGLEAFERSYMKTGFAEMIRKRGGWLAVLFLGEMLTASAMQHYADDLAKAVALTLFIPLIISSGGNSGSQATSLLIRALALQEVRPGDWWRVVFRELLAGVTLGALLAVIGMGRIAGWQLAGFYDYGEHWPLIALTVGAALVGVVTFGSVAGSMLPMLMRALRFDPATASAPFVATLVDVTGIVIYLSIAVALLTGTVL